jgi:hypothetical protein
MNRLLQAGFDQSVHRPALGVVFRNPADDRVVSDGLLVRLKDPQRPHQTSQPLFANGYGIFVAHQVHGLGTTLPTSPAATRRYTLSVEDRLGRFLPVTAPVDLPTEGLLDLAHLRTSPATALPHLPLFSASSYAVPAGQAEVRVDLRLASNASAAAWARVELWLEDPHTLLAQGLADARGSALLVCALPALRDPPLRASPAASQTTLSQWTVRLHVFWNSAIAKATVPDLSDLLSLPEVPVLQSPSSTTPLAPAVLGAGSPLVFRSPGSSCVFVGA